MAIDQISVFVENKPGRLVNVVEMLGKNGIDLRAMSIADTTDFGILRLIVDDTKRAVEILKNDDFVASVNDVIAVSISDAPGSLAGVLKIISEAGVSIEYIYAFITHRRDSAYVVIQTDNNARAIEVMLSEGVRIAEREDLFDK